MEREDIIDISKNTQDRISKKKKSIKLEVLSKRGVYGILGINWSVFFIALLFDFVEVPLRLNEQNIQATLSTGYPLPMVFESNETQETGSYSSGPNPVSPLWGAEINGMNVLNRFLMMNVYITNTTRKFRFDYNVYSRKSSDEAWVLFVPTADITCDVVGTCTANNAAFYTPTIFYPDYRIEISNIVPYPEPNQNVVVECTYHSSLFSVVELSINAVLLSVSLIVLVYYVLQTRCFAENRLPEQGWITYLIVAIFLFQNPLYFLYVRNPDPYMKIGGQLMIVVSSTLFFIFWLLLMNGLSRPNHLFSFWSFYFRKFFFGFLLLLTGTCVVVLPISQLAIKNIPLELLVVLAAFLEILGLLIWFCWFIRTLHVTRKWLNRIRFLETRYRQLSYRFFLLLSVLAIVYIVFKYLFKWVFHFFSGTNEQYAIATQYANLGGALFLLSSYAYSVAFVFLPPAATIGFTRCTATLVDQEEAELEEAVLLEKSNRNESMFCLETAAWLFEMAYLVYYDPEDQITKSGYGKMDMKVVADLGFRLHRFVSDTTSDSQVLIATKEDIVVIAFRGTSSFENVMTDLKMKTESIPHRPRGMEALQFQPKVHLGFWRVFQSIWPQVKHFIEELITESSKPPRFYLTGHSLGGALAVLGAFELSTEMPNLSITMYNFGAPRAGNHAFAEMYNRQVPNSFRVVNSRDVITSVPKFLWVFKHVGKEIIIDRRGNLITDLTPVERIMRGTKHSAAHHSMDAYKVGLVACCKEIDPDSLTTSPIIRSLHTRGSMSPVGAEVRLSLNEGLHHVDSEKQYLLQQNREEEEEEDDEVN